MLAVVPDGLDAHLAEDGQILGAVHAGDAAGYVEDASGDLAGDQVRVIVAGGAESAGGDFICQMYRAGRRSDVRSCDDRFEPAIYYRLCMPELRKKTPVSGYGRR